MTVFLAILKWIGITVGAVLGLLLLVAALVLFVPIRYRVVVEADEDVKVGYRFSFFPFAMIRKKPGSGAVCLYVFGIRIKNLSEGDKQFLKTGTDRKKTEKKTGKEGGKNAGKNSGGINTGGKDAAVKDAEDGGGGGTGTDTDTGTDTGTDTDTDTGTGTDTDTGTGTETAGAENSVGVKKQKKFSKKKISSIIDFARDKETKRQVRKLMGHMSAVFRYLLQGKVRADFRIGTGDPAWTGYLFGGISIFPAVYNNKEIHLLPDFEEKVFCGKGEVLGKVRGVRCLIFVLKPLLDKDIRKLFRDLKNII